VVKKIINGNLNLDLKFLKLLILKALNDGQNHTLNNVKVEFARAFSEEKLIEKVQNQINSDINLNKNEDVTKVSSSQQHSE
jgi:hypothetical protein